MLAVSIKLRYRTKEDPRKNFKKKKTFLRRRKHWDRFQTSSFCKSIKKIKFESCHPATLRYDWLTNETVPYNWHSSFLNLRKVTAKELSLYRTNFTLLIVSSGSQPSLLHKTCHLAARGFCMIYFFHPIVNKQTIITNS